MSSSAEAQASSDPPAEVPNVPAEARAEREGYEALIERLSRQSVSKHFDAYDDIAWDAPEMQVDPADPRWIPRGEVGLTTTAWFRALPVDLQARISLHTGVSFMKIGIEFENILSRGLLEFAAGLPNGSPEFRYAYHEVIEEGQHSLMFQELVNRSGLDVKGLPRRMRWLGRQVVGLGRIFPELFFIFVLGGEDPIDHVQRIALARRQEAHPLVRRIMQIHVTEEARHLCFARHYLRKHVPLLGPVKKLALRIFAPIVLGMMAELMMRPPKAIIAKYGVPDEVVAEAFTNNPAHRARTQEALRKVRDLCVELDIATPTFARLWRALGLWAAPA